MCCRSAGGAAKRVTDLFNDAHQPQWSPDSKSIVFFGYRDGGYDLWEVGADGSNQHMLTEGTFDDREPIFSHDGSKIAFSSDRGNPLGSDNNIWVMDVKTGALTQLTTNPAEDVMPAWSADDKEIIFTSSRDAYKTLWAVNVATKAERKIATSNGNIAAASMGPDGQLVYRIVGRQRQPAQLRRQGDHQNEVVFPFRPSWVSKNEFFYVADGKIKRRTLGGGVKDIPFSVDFGNHAAAQHLCPQEARFRQPDAAQGAGHRCGRLFRRTASPSPLPPWAISGCCRRPAASRKI